MKRNFIIRHKFTRDPTALVYNDRVYVGTGHDEAPEGADAYVMNDWLCFSSADLVHWDENPTPWRAKDFSPGKGDAYASKLIGRKSPAFILYRLPDVQSRRYNQAGNHDRERRSCCYITAN